MNSKDIYIHKNLSSKLFTIKRKIRQSGVYEPFVYIIQHKETKLKYIGCRHARGCLETDLGTKYFTSSKYVNWKDNPEAFEIVDIFPCYSNYDAILLEIDLIKRYNAHKSKKYLNKSIPSKKRSGGVQGYFTAYDKDGNKFFINNEDYRFKNGLLFGQRKYKKMPKEFCENLSNKMKSKVVVKDKNGNNFLISKNDKRYITGELVPIATGRKVSDETRLKLSMYNKGRVVSKETKNKISNSLTGRKIPKETRLKMSKAQKGKYVSEETRRKLSKKLKGRKCTPEQIERNRQSHIGILHTKETKNKISSTVSKLIWVNDGVKCSRVKEENLKDYINNGWKLGRTKIKRNDKIYKCPHCGKEARGNVIFVHHFDKCKFK